MIAVTGYNTTILQELRKITAERMDRIHWDCIDPPVAARYVFAAGILYNKTTQEQTRQEWLTSVMVNFASVIQHCEDIFRRGEPATVCVIGSESAEKGCFDGTYATCKRALHVYVRARKMGTDQRITCVAPPIIADSGMTRRRHDYPVVLEERRTVPAAQVAHAVFRHLYDSDQSNIVEYL